MSTVPSSTTPSATSTCWSHFLGCRSCATGARPDTDIGQCQTRSSLARHSEPFGERGAGEGTPKLSPTAIAVASLFDRHKRPSSETSSTKFQGARHTCPKLKTPRSVPSPRMRCHQSAVLRWLEAGRVKAPFRITHQCYTSSRFWIHDHVKQQLPPSRMSPK